MDYIKKIYNKKLISIIYYILWLLLDKDKLMKLSTMKEQ